MNCYKVIVNNSNTLKNSFKNKQSVYIDCENSTIYVTTDNITHIVEYVGSNNIESIEKIGKGMFCND